MTLAGYDVNASFSQAPGCKVRRSFVFEADDRFARVRCCADRRSPWPCITVCGTVESASYQATSPVLCRTHRGDKTGLLTLPEAARECVRRYDLEQMQTSLCQLSFLYFPLNRPCTVATSALARSLKRAGAVRRAAELTLR